MQRKEFIKNFIFTFFILMIAVISTYYIYHRFDDDRSIDFNSDSLDVVYKENTGDKISLTKVTPVTDSVGMTSKSYMISITNNLTESVDYTVKVLDDLDEIMNDGCVDRQITKDNIKISVKVNKEENQIYQLDQLLDGVVLNHQIEALGTDNIALRLWIKQDSDLPSGSKLHYHGKMQIVEGNQSIAIIDSEESEAENEAD